MTKTHLIFRTTLALAAAGAAFGAPAANPAIGMAMANGSFQVDRTRVTGNATLFDGSLIDTGAASSQIQLDGGQRLRLASETRAQVYRKKLVLESGFGQLEAAPGFEVEARTLRISAASPDTMARIRLAADLKVTVAAVRGSVRVTNALGLLVANVPAGSSLDFEPQPAGASAATLASGCLLQKSGRFILAEQTTNQVLEVQGEDLDKQLGNRVRVTGTATNTPVTVAEATQVIQVADLKLVAKRGCRVLAAKLGAAGAAGAGAGAASAGAGAGAASAGIGAGTIAVIGGVAAAATVGGLAAAGKFPGQGEDLPTSASR